MEQIRIRRAELSDIENIIVFIRDYYHIKNHVFTRKRELFYNWHVNGNDLWIVIAEGCESKKIYGMLAYTLYTIEDDIDVAFTLFQTIKSGDPTLGIRIIKFIQELYPGGCICGCGILPHTTGLYAYFGFQTGKLKHYYRLSDRTEYRIAQVGSKRISPVKREGHAFRLFDSMEMVRKYIQPDAFDWSVPRKNFDYVERRYFNNLGYRYQVYGIFDAESYCVGMFTGRQICQNGAKCFKIVDYIGNDEELRYCGGAFSRLVEDNDYEFAHFYEIGIPDEIMMDAGFVLNDEKDNIIPQHFEPFVQENIDIYYFTSQPKKFHGYLSDGGRERPNYIDGSGQNIIEL